MLVICALCYIIQCYQNNDYTSMNSILTLLSRMLLIFPIYQFLFNGINNLHIQLQIVTNNYDLLFISNVVFFKLVRDCLVDSFYNQIVWLNETIFCPEIGNELDLSKSINFSNLGSDNFLPAFIKNQTIQIDFNSVKPSGVILCLKVRELHSLYIYILSSFLHMAV